MEDDRPDVISLALIMIWEAKDEAGKNAILSLMKRVTTVINREIEFNQKQAAFANYMSNFNMKIDSNSEDLQPLSEEAEALLKRALVAVT